MSLARLRELIHSRTDGVHDDESQFVGGSGGQLERALLEIEGQSVDIFIAI